MSEGTSVPGFVLGTTCLGNGIISIASAASVATVPADDELLFKLISVSPSISTLPPAALILIAPSVAVKYDAFPTKLSVVSVLINISVAERICPCASANTYKFVFV